MAPDRWAAGAVAVRASWCPPWALVCSGAWAWARSRATSLSWRGPLEAQRGTLFVWVPVLLGVGVGLYFALPYEPRLLHYALAGAGAIAALAVALRIGMGRAVIPMAICLVLVGLMAAGARANIRAAPVLDYRYYGPVEGRVVTIDRSASGAVRLTLDRVALRNVAPDRMPARVRISLHGVPVQTIVPGQWLGLTANLSPPAGPTEPQGFDFQRMAWFDRLGAVGYTPCARGACCGGGSGRGAVVAPPARGPRPMIFAASSGGRRARLPPRS